MNYEPLIPLRLRLLFDAICDGVPTAEQLAELEAILRSDEQARRLYREYCRLHVDLHFVVRGRRAMDAVGDAIHGDVLRKENRSPVLGFLGQAGQQSWGFLSEHAMLFSVLAAVLVVGSLATLAGVAIHGRQRVEIAAASPPMARISSEINCRWNNAEAGLSPGAELTAGQKLELAAGEAEIAFRSGAVVVVRGPSILQIESDNSARLLVGRVTARAETEQSHGFTLRRRPPWLTWARSSMFRPPPTATAKSRSRPERLKSKPSSIRPSIACKSAIRPKSSRARQASLP